MKPDAHKACTFADLDEYSRDELAHYVVSLETLNCDVMRVFSKYRRRYPYSTLFKQLTAEFDVLLQTKLEDHE